MITKNTIVILPTNMEVTYETSPNDPNSDIKYEGYTQYRFTVEQALAFLSDPDNEGLLIPLIFNNIPLRHCWREIGIAALVDKLKSFYEVSDSLSAFMDRIVEQVTSMNGALADFEIQVLPTTHKLNFYGKTFRGFKGLYHNTDNMLLEKRLREGDYSEFEKAKQSDGGANILAIYQPYDPDNSNYLPDGYPYCNFLISDGRIDKERVEAFIRTAGEFSPLSDVLSPKALPVVCYSGLGGFMPHPKLCVMVVCKEVG